MAAVSSIVLSHKSPVTVLLPSDSYHGVPTVLADQLSRFDITFKTVDYTNPSNLEIALSSQVGKDVIVWLETPSNPLCQVIDIEATCAIVNEFRPYANITTVVDSTLAPPCVTQPLRVSEKLMILHSIFFAPEN
jgi:cystathionine beta-lyase/cystathionine gamma-synthase